MTLFSRMSQQFLNKRAGLFWVLAASIHCMCDTIVLGASYMNMMTQAVVWQRSSL